MKVLVISVLLPLALAARYRALAPVIVSPQEAEIVPGKYIVRMKDGTEELSLEDSARITGQAADYVYNIGNFRALSGSFNHSALEALRRHPAVRT